VTARQHAENVLLALGVGCELLCALGLLVMRNALDRLHYVMASTGLGSMLIVAAVVVHESFKSSGINAIVVGIVLLLGNSVLAHATARMIRRRGRP
jgi:multisubunit Na+/H+ antiporter MnhG subunit